ncbi:MAG: thioredoxin-disulfide reductase [Velocimicrobium sp.]
MNHIYDTIIIGSGPAGLTAGIYGKRAQLDVLIIEKSPMSGGQIINTYEVDNYPGMPGVTGFDLASQFREHCDKLGVPFAEGEVLRADLDTPIKKVWLDDEAFYEAKTIIIAGGAVYRKLLIPGEVEFSGKGVSYCATCDGAFYKNQVVAVVGGGDVAVEDAIFLARGCKTVYLIHRRDALRAAKTLITQLHACENIEIIWDSVVEKIEGDEFVESIAIKNLNTMEVSQKKVGGVFVAVGTVPNTEIYGESLELNESGYIVAGENCVTNLEGVFAAGDIRTKHLKQIITAAADGANSITTVERYLNEQ